MNLKWKIILFTYAMVGLCAMIGIPLTTPAVWWSVLTWAIFGLALPVGCLIKALLMESVD